MNRFAWAGIFAAGVVTGLVATVSLDWATPSRAEPTAAPAPQVLPPQAGPDRALPEFSRVFVDVVKKVHPSVVQINVVKRWKESQPYLDFDPLFGFLRRREREQVYEQPSLGSGVIIDDRGNILTNSHVVDGASEIEVVLHDGRRIRASLVGVDRLTDLALVRIQSKGLQPAALGNSDRMEVGEWVLAIGSPMGYAQTVTNGIISAKERKGVANDTGMFQNFLQTSAPINPGNSGGPLVNLSAEVIGINTAIASYTGQSAGIGFAIPINRTRDVVAKLIKSGRVEWGWMGVGVEEDADGVRIMQVHREGPAIRVLRPGDLITAYNGKPIRHADEFREAIANTAPGAQARITFQRGDATHEREVTIALHPAVEAR